MLDLQWQVFKCVVEKESFSLAAQELHMTQSAVSQQIHTLESFYGVKLFDRLYRRILVTEAGRALYPYAVELERLYQTAEQTMHGLMDVISGNIEIGASLTIGEYLLPEIMVHFSRLYPLAHIAMTVENTEKVIASVVDGSVSLGFVEGLYVPVATLADYRCGGDQLVVIASPDLAAKFVGPVSIADLLHEKWVLREPNSGTRRVFEEFVHSQGITADDLTVTMELGSTEAIKSTVKVGMGLGVISCLAVENEVDRGELVILPLTEGRIERNFTMLYHREKFQIKAVKKFSEYVLETLLTE